MLGHLGIAESTWNRWRSRDGGMRIDEVKRLKELEHENTRHKKTRPSTSTCLRRRLGDTSGPGARPQGRVHLARALRGVVAPGLAGPGPAPLDRAAHPGTETGRGGETAPAAPGDRPYAHPLGTERPPTACSTSTDGS